MDILLKALGIFLTVKRRQRLGSMSEGRENGFNFGHIKFELAVKYPNVKQTTGNGSWSWERN